MMSTFDLLLLSVALAMDCFTVSIMAGVILRRPVTTPIVRMAVLFGLFQALMPLFGWLGTAHFSHYLEAVDHWIAFGLLAFIGGKMVWESFGEDEHQSFDPLRLHTQVVLAVATSIDALAVGISMACLGYTHIAQLTMPLTMIGVVSLLFSLAGYWLGVRFGRAIARRMKPELVGGLVLIFIGVKVLLSHLPKWSAMMLAFSFVAVNSMGQSADRSKLSPMLADKLNLCAVAGARGVGETSFDDEMVLSLVKLTAGEDDGVLTQHGCKVIDRVGDICIALLPVSQLAALSVEEHVLRMEASPLSRPMLDVTPDAVHVGPAWQGLDLPQAFTGRGVVVGFADVGFDYTNPMFVDADGQTRIRQAWDIYTGGADGYKNIGTQYTTPEALAVAKGSCDSTQYHGTHVAAIAAGGVSLGGCYRGIACEADIVMSHAYLSGYTKEQNSNLIASLNATLRQGTADSLVTAVAYKRITLSNAMEALAVRYAFDYAADHGQPCVVNCSFGSQMDLTKDYSVMQELMNSLTGPGRIIVCSAGNYGDGIIYKVKPAGETMNERLWFKGTLTPEISLRTDGDFTLKMLPDIDGADTLCITSADIRKSMEEQGVRTDSAAVASSEMNGWLFAESKAYEVFPGLTSYSVEYTLPTPVSAYKTPSMAFIVEGEAAVEVMGAVNGATFNRLSAGSNAVNAPYTVTVPGIYDQMIAVGLTSHRDSVVNLEGEHLTYEYNSNELGKVVSWSSAGPTLEGKVKPDVVAPGHNIISALNSHLNIDTLSQKKRRMLVDVDTYGGRRYFWKAESGSSMSAPVVTGVIALWLQANPRLTPDDVKQVLAATATHPEPGISYPDNRYGHGEIDAYKGLLYIVGMTGVEGLSEHQPAQAAFSLTGRTLRVGNATEADITVFALGGQVAMRTRTTDGIVDLNCLKPGIYAIQVNTGKDTTTGSTLVRLER